MKRGCFILFGFFVFIVTASIWGLSPATAHAGQTETTPVACKEGVIREPILLKYGEHTDGCQLDYVTDQDQFSFYGNTGDEVTIAVGWTSNSYKRTLLITALGPGGATILQESTVLDGFNNGQYWRKSILLTETGTHFIFIEEKEHNATAGYQLAIEGIPPMVAPPRLSTSSSVQASIDGPADIDLFTFQASAGSLLHIPVSFSSDPYMKTMRLQVRDPKGAILVDQTSVRDGFNEAVNMILNLSITKSGRYYLMVDGEGTSFDYELVLQCFSGTCQDLQPQPAVEGCLREQGRPLAGVKVKLEQAGKPNRYKVTDSRGCYSFPSVVADLEYRVSVVGTVE